MDDSSRRQNEAVVLDSMYGEDFTELTSSEWCLRWNGEVTQAVLNIQLFEDYPSCSLPILVLDAPGRAGLGEACQELLVGLVPGEEEQLIIEIARRFSEWCDRGSDPEISMEGCQGAVGDADADVTIGVDPVAAMVEVNPSIAREIGLSLLNAGFQQHGPDIFVQGELGVAIEIREALHVSVDGVDDGDNLVGWVAQHVGMETASFGDRLLRWVETRRARDEEVYGSADGIADVAAVSPHDGGAVLSGNAAWKARLQAGETVAFRGKGNSLHPRIKSGECCQYAPVFKHEDIKENDIVFCQIKGRYWGHKVKRKTRVGCDESGSAVYEYTISNIHGWENGTCTLEHVYGKVIDHWK